MKNQPISLRKVAYTLIILCIVGYLLRIGRNILIPLTFAALFAFMLKPICEKIERFVPWRGIAIFLAFLVVLLPVAGVMGLLSAQLLDVIQSFSAIDQKLESGINEFYIWLQQQFGFSRTESEKWVTEQAPSLLKGPLSTIGASMTSSTTYLINFALTFIYTFFFLFYRSAFRNFVLIQVDKEHRSTFYTLVSRIQKIIQKYLLGLSIVILILGGLNSFALWLIGIKYALFWGYMAGILAIIPYIGTFIGAILPFLFALATTNTAWQPIAVLVAFNLIQIIESNFITPKIAGSSVKINPLAAILALITGGAIWGVAGLVLALPTIAIIKIVTEQFQYLQPFSFLLSSSLQDEKEVLLEEYDDKQFRLVNFFRKSD